MYPHGNSGQRRAKFSRYGVPQPVFHHLKLPIHHLAMPLGQLIFGKIIKTVETRGQILRLKCSKRYLGWGSALAGGAYSAPQTFGLGLGSGLGSAVAAVSSPAIPNLLAWIKGPTSKGRVEGKDKKWRGGEWREKM